MGAPLAPSVNSKRLICAVLNGEPARWHATTDTLSTTDFIDVGRQQGVLPLLDAEFQRQKVSANWPEEILVACHQARLAQTAYEIAHGAEIERVLAALATAGVTTLFLKGTGLAYSLYSSPMLRPRADTDLLVAPEMREAACGSLQSLGYNRVGGPAGKFVGYQIQLQRRDAFRLVHNIDLHWRIRDEQSFAWLFSFAELAAAAAPVPKLNPHALRLGNAHSLLLCLMHRAGNNVFQSPGFGDRLIWLYDIDLLVAAMTIPELDDFRTIAVTRGLGAIAVDGLMQCAEQFHSTRIAVLIDDFERSAHANSGSDLLTAGRLRREWIELRAIPGVGPRFAYLAGRAFPYAEYMRERYPESAARALPLLHARRWVEGLGHFVRKRPREWP